MNINNKKMGIPLMLSFSIALGGCGESSDELDEKLTSNAKVSFINSLNYMADFHFQKRNISTGYGGLFDSDELAVSEVPAYEIGDIYNYSYKLINNMINIGVKNSVTASNKTRMTTTLDDNDNLWVIAWEASNEQFLSVIDKRKGNNANKFNVRLFANGNYNVYLSEQQIFTTEKGKATDYITVDNCNNELKIDEQNIDLCMANIGFSYLLVVDNTGKLVMAEE